MTSSVLRRIPLVAVAVAVLGGCGANSTEFAQAVFKDLQTCERHYRVAVGSGSSGFSAPSLNGSAEIDCQPIGNPAQVTPGQIQSQILAPSPPVN